MRAELIEALRKHLPPSAAALRLLDVDGAAGARLARLRADLDSQAVSGPASEWRLTPDSWDAVTAVEREPDEALLAVCLRALRPGGRLIVTLAEGEVSAAWVQRLEAAGYTRILVEPALADGRGLLLRGEKPHTEQRTTDRIAQVAGRDAATDLDSYTGRYVYLLIQQKPNRPVWALRPDDVIEWRAVAVTGDYGPALLAFSSLPKAVAFMQPAVLRGLIRDVNKVGKFSRETARGWPLAVRLNPTVEDIDGCEIAFWSVDPQTAEVPDE